jgi:hypothetical protein
MLFPRSRGVLWILCSAVGLSASASATVDAGALEARPLFAAPRALGGPLFEALPPERTGVTRVNRYDDPRMWGALYQEFTTGAIGTGVAIGDVDGDGRPDLALATKTAGLHLYRNLGDWRFEDVTARAGLASSGGAWLQGVALADIDNDGDLDLYACRFAAPNLLYVNRGDGTFREEAAARGLALVDASGMAAFADYDRDGDLDVLVQTNLLDAARRPQGQPNRLFRNDGAGRFTDVSVAAGISGDAQGHSATWWDYDRDGWPDLHVANDFAAPDKLYRNQGDGTFRDVLSAALPHQPYSSMGADFGDVNNDGHFDLLVADMAATTREKDQRGMADARARLRGAPDRDASAPQYPWNALYLGTGTGRLHEAAHLAGLAATDWTWAVRCEDFDQDGYQDFFITTGMVRELTNLDLIARVSAAQNVAQRLALARAAPVLAEPNLAFRNLGDLRFESVGAAWGLDESGVSFGAATGDLGGTGNLDLVYANLDGTFSIRRNRAEGHRVVFRLRGTASNRYGIGATVRIETASGPQVRQLALARGYLSSSEPLAHFGLGAERVIRRIDIEWPSGRRQSFTDLAADHAYLITEPASEPRALRPAALTPPAFTEVASTDGLAHRAVETSFDEEGQQPLVPFRLDRRGPEVGVLTDAAGAPERIVFGGTPTTPATLYARTARGFARAGELTRATTKVSDGPLAVLDARGEGRADLLVTKGGARLPAGAREYQPDLLLSDGAGGFTAAPEGALPTFTSSVGAVAAADFVREGRLGVFLGARLRPGQYPRTPQSALWRARGDGTFEDVTDRLAPELRQVGLVTAALWSDVNDDGWPDLLVALDWGHVKCFRNEAGQRLVDATNELGFCSAGAGWWTGLVALDANGDGRLDYVAGNAGLNTPYAATAENPAVLFAGDFRDSGTTQLVEAISVDGKLFPRRARRDIAAAIPSIARRFPSNDAYARATLPELVGEARLRAARRFEVTELRSGVFLSQPDGRFAFAPLPVEAQLAPLQGMVAGHFEGREMPSLAALQNSHAPAAATGRFAGGTGVLLRVAAGGGWGVVSPPASGFVVSGDAQALTLADLDRDGWPDLLATTSDGEARVFRQLGANGAASPLRVRLRGAAGNPGAVGTRVVATAAAGRRSVAEVSSAAPGGVWLPRPTGAVLQLEVRWPNGVRTTAEVPAGAGQIELASPP